MVDKETKCHPEELRSSDVRIHFDCLIGSPRRPYGLLAMTLMILLSSSSVQAAQEQALEPISATNGQSLQAPASKPEQNTNPKLRQVNIKNEFYESIKITLDANDPSAEIKNKEIYLNPYQTRADVTIAKNVDYKIKVYNAQGAYLGYLINTETRKSPSINISPFLLVQDIKKPIAPVVLAPKEESIMKVDTKKEAEKSRESEVIEAKTPEPKEVQLNQEPETMVVSQSDDKFLKVSNLTEINYKLNIVLPSGETVNKTWNIDNDSYLPEFLDLNSKHFVVKPDYKIVITDKKSKEETSKLVSELNIDEQGNYTWIIGDQDTSK